MTNLNPGGSLQDMRGKPIIVRENKSVSAGSLRTQGSDSGSSEFESVGQQSSEGSLAAEGKEQVRTSKSPELTILETSDETLEGQTTPMNASIKSKEGKEVVKSSVFRSRSNSIGSELQRPNGTTHLLPPPGPGGRSHRRQGSLGVISGSGSFPLRIHKRYQSLSMAGSSSKSTSLSERFLGNLECHETASICSQRSRISLLPSSRVEQSRTNTKTIIEDLFQTHDLSHTEEDEGSSGLKLYVDKDQGTITVAGVADLDR